MHLVRINQFLARAGLGSRRECELLILDSQVSINGELCLDLSKKINPKQDKVFYRGRLLEAVDKDVYYVFHKPRGLVCTQYDPFYPSEKTIYHYLKSIPERVFSVGRLDKESHGLMLLTNDGDLSHFLTHPSYKIPKVYIVVIKGYLSAHECGRLLDGIELEEGKAKIDQLNILVSSREKTKLKIVLKQGLNRQIRRMMKSIHKLVLDIQRIQFGPVKIGGLKKLEHRCLTTEEIDALKSHTKMDSLRNRMP